MADCRTLKDCFAESGRTYGRKTAIAFFREGVLETEIGYGDLHADAGRLANTLVAMGVGRGDRVLLFMPKSLFFVVAHLALQQIGAVAVPLNPGFKRDEVAYLAADADAVLALAGPAQADILRSVAAALETVVIDTAKPYQAVDFFRQAAPEAPAVEVRPGDPALIIYTSGTTGRPKGAVLTHGNLVHDAANVIDIWKISRADVLCHALPLFHVHGLCFALHTALMAGSRVVMLDAFRPEQVIDFLSRREEENACTVFMAVPAMYAKLMDAVGDRRIDFDHLRLLTSGSAPLLVKDFEAIRRVFGREPVEREGMSETGMNFSNPVDGVRKPGSIGLPLPGVQVRIVDPQTLQDVRPGEAGEIWLKSPAITHGYWRKPKETAEAFHHGWFRSGDLGKVDPDGYYYLTDRIKHIIISGGENISPKEVELVLNRMPQVVESCVVGIADEKWGEKVVAAVVPEPGADVTFAAIKTHCRRHLHDWKCPRQVIFVQSLPRNTMGKVLKEEVKKLF
jgi:malonyl-CoA/methylmalonyl-CoA synthetase